MTRARVVGEPSKDNRHVVVSPRDIDRLLDSVSTEEPDGPNSYLRPALYAEGPTDYYFLLPLLNRLVRESAARLFSRRQRGRRGSRN